MGSSCSQQLGRSSPQGSDVDQPRLRKFHQDQGAMNIGGRMEIGTININNNIPKVTRTQDEMRDALIGFFKFPSMTNRRDNIDSTYRETCTWLLRTSEWLRWRRNSSSLLWIKGNPGAGKSTMMKFAVKNVPRESNEHVISHFFNARGAGDLEKSAEGLYRALLVQLLRDVSPENLVKSKSLREASEESVEKEWPLPELLDLLQEVLELLAPDPVTIFLDALDECNEQQLQDMVDCLCDLLEAQSNTQLRICFASRYFPHITREEAIDLWLEKQKDHYKDVYVYIEGQIESSKMNLSKPIRNRLQEKAAGSFIWAYLVIRLLKNEYRKGNIAGLEALLESMPEKLEDLYKNILNSKAGDDRHETLMCFKWVLLARRPLKVEELWWALRISVTHTDADAITLEELRHMADDDVRRRLLDISCGLVSPSESGAVVTVQFIHETTRKFCLQEAGLDADSEIDQTQDLFKRSCWRTVKLAIGLRGQTESLQDNPRSNAKDGTDPSPPKTAGNVGFTAYATNYVLEHADQAQAGGLDQSTFLVELMSSRESVASIYMPDTSVLPRRPLHPHPYMTIYGQTNSMPVREPNFFLRYSNINDLLMARDLGHLVSKCQSQKELALRETRLGIDRDEKHETAATAAMDRGQLSALQALISLHVNRRAEHHEIRDLLARLGKDAYNALRDSGVDRTFTRTGLTYADVLFDLAEDAEALAAFFLASIISPTFISPRSFARLSDACQQGFLHILTFILEERMVARWTPFSADDALLWASRHGHTPVVKTLLENHNPNIRPSKLMPGGSDPISEAILGGHVDIVKMLVNYSQPALF